MTQEVSASRTTTRPSGLRSRLVKLTGVVAIAATLAGCYYPPYGDGYYGAYPAGYYDYPVGIFGVGWGWGPGWYGGWGFRGGWGYGCCGWRGGWRGGYYHGGYGFRGGWRR